MRSGVYTDLAGAFEWELEGSLQRIPLYFQGSFFQSVATAKKLKSVTFFTSKMHLVESAVSSLVTAVYSDLGMRSSKTTRMAV